MADTYLPYGHQTLDADDIEAVIRVLASDFLTTGPEVAAFEADLAAESGASHAAVLNSCTSALHAAYAAIGVGPGDEIVTSPLTFAATGNAALYLGARPVFVDIVPSTGLIDPHWSRAPSPAAPAPSWRSTTRGSLPTTTLCTGSPSGTTCRS